MLRYRAGFCLKFAWSKSLIEGLVASCVFFNGGKRACWPHVGSRGKLARLDSYVPLRPGFVICCRQCFRENTSAIRSIWNKPASGSLHRVSFIGYSRSEYPHSEYSQALKVVLFTIVGLSSAGPSHWSLDLETYSKSK